MTPHTFSLGIVNCSTHTIAQLLDEIRTLLSDKTLGSRVLLCVNSHIYNLACKDAVLRKNLGTARIVAADGMAIVWAARLFGTQVQQRCNMTEAFRTFLQDANMPDSTAVLVGATEDEAQAAAQRIEQRCSHCRISSTVSGFLSDDEYRALFSSLKQTDLIFLGMGTPRTEHVSMIAHAVCPEAVIWGIGGGTIRIFAGTMKEAPVFMRRTGLQWIHRLYRSPQVLWRRYLIGNPLFVYRILKARFLTRTP